MSDCCIAYYMFFLSYLLCRHVFLQLHCSSCCCFYYCHPQTGCSVIKKGLAKPCRPGLLQTQSSMLKQALETRFLTWCRAFTGAERGIVPDANDATPLMAWGNQPKVGVQLCPCIHQLQIHTSSSLCPVTNWAIVQLCVNCVAKPKSNRPMMPSPHCHRVASNQPV